MRLAEVDGKALLRRHGLAAPRGILLGAGDDPPEELIRHWPGYFLKAQLLEGGRGKRGLVRRFDHWIDFRNARRLILATLDDADTRSFSKRPYRSAMKFTSPCGLMAANTGSNSLSRRRAAKTSSKQQSLREFPPSVER